MAGNFTEFNNPKKRAFLNAYAETGRFDLAAQAAHVTRFTHYHWMHEDAEYPTAFAAAQQMAADMLETEAIRRAVTGVDKPIFWKGRQISSVKEYDTTLLIFMLKGLRPEKYRDRLQIDVTGYLRDLAEVNGLDADEVIREAQGIVATGRSS